VPERDDLQHVLLHSVVDKLPDAPQVQPAHDVWSRSLDLASNPRFPREQVQSAFEISKNSTRRRRAIPRPPFSSSFDFALSAWLDPEQERQGQPKR
jgi:hypothetical protein